MKVQDLFDPNLNLSYVNHNIWKRIYALVIKNLFSTCCDTLTHNIIKDGTMTRILLLLKYNLNESLFEIYINLKKELIKTNFAASLS